jgi:hypothetical protein
MALNPCRSWSGLLLRTPPLLRGRLPVALLEIREHDRQNELSFTVVIEFDHDVFFAARKNASQSEFGVFHLRALRERGFICHAGGDLLLQFIVTKDLA